MSTHTIAITVDGTDITGDVKSWEITMQGPPAFCFEGKINLKSDTRWALCDPDTSPGALRLTITIDGDAWQFLIEERGESITHNDYAFWVSGRSKQALLGEGYALPVSDDASTEPRCGPGFEDYCDESGCIAAGGSWDSETETCTFSGGDTPETHPWQEGDTTPSAIITYLLASDYCPHAVSVTWNVEDYPIRKGTLSVGTAYPVGIIAQLAQAIGADLIPHADGSLTIDAFKAGDLSAETARAAYTGLDDIITLSSTRQPASGINAVTVIGGVGEEAGGEEASSFLAAEAAEPVEQDWSHDVKVYWYHPTSDPIITFEEGGGQASYISAGTDSITETVRLSWGHGNTSKPDTQGETAVYFARDKGKLWSEREVTYDCKFKKYAVSAVKKTGEGWNYPGDWQVDFYFDDLSAQAAYSFTIDEREEEIYRAQTFNVLNGDTQVPIAGASIYIDGDLKGTTDSEGIYTTSDTYLVGSSYPLRITATGFADSDADELANDDFVAQ